MTRHHILWLALLPLFVGAFSTLIAAESSDSASAKQDQWTLAIEINRPNTSRRYRKPYVAAWIEDKDGFPVKTLALWMMTKNPGPRWHRDLRQWYENDRMRLLVEDANLISGVDGISGATRSPGKYKVEWDGSDNAGKALDPGKYTLFVESAREHGRYQLIKGEIVLDGQPFKEELKGNAEIKAVSIERRTKK